MSSKELELDFEFSNDELANFLENFAGKIRDGKVGLSFKGREEIEIEPTADNEIELEYKQGSEFKQLEIEVKLREDIESTDEGRKKIEVEIV